MTLPVFDLSTPDGRQGFEQRLQRLRATASLAGEAARTVGAVLEDVRRRGDAAVVDYMRQWTDPHFEAGRIRVAREEIAAAEKTLAGPLRAAIEASIANVRAYQRHILPTAPPPVTIAGAELGLRYTPVESAGLCVPGGAAVLFSTLIMLAVPAMVAGVDPQKLSVISPPPTRAASGAGGPGHWQQAASGTRASAPSDISPIVLAVCHLLGIEKVYRIGGAQGVAALAYGTESVEPVNLIAGPGNVYVQLAKQMVSGVAGTDNGFYGPSEIVTLADETADPRCIAADLIAQAEHNPGKCFLIAWSRPVIERILAEVDRQRRQRGRLAAIDKALAEESAAILADSEAQAAEIADTIAAEHVNLAVADPSALLAKLRHGGEFFLGDQTPVAAGDYYAGPSHCLPTGTTARFASGISVHTFLKRSGTVWYRRGLPRDAAAAIATLAEAEGLDAHAESARVRGER